MINMVVGGEVVTLKSLEESSSLIITEMPINVSTMLALFLLTYGSVNIKSLLHFVLLFQSVTEISISGLV